MNLQLLLCQIDYVVIQEVNSIDKIEVKNIVCNSKKVRENDIFICIDGEIQDGHDYIGEAYDRGTRVVVIEKMGKHGHLLDLPDDMTVILVRDTKEAYAQMAINFFHCPAESMKIIGITGTKGKTTVAVMVRHMLEEQGNKVGMIGTLGIFDGKEWIFTKNTTPDAFTIQEYFVKMKDNGCEYVVMEVSSQGMKQKRVYGIPFWIGVFTNLGEDHIGPHEHASLSEYRYYKSRLFRQCRIGIGNLDDIHTGYMFRRSVCEKYGYTCQTDMGTRGISGESHILRAREIRFQMEQGVLMTHFCVGDTMIRLQLPGMFNVYNAMAALSVMHCLEMPVDQCAKKLEDVRVCGRMERVPWNKNIACYIDYAHNGMSLKQALQTLRLYHPARILLVFGCGGGRARNRRFEMGRVAGEFADEIILTNDNPREEKPERIIGDIAEGIGNRKFDIIPDRRIAVREAIDRAKAGDIVLIAGKGHETYQEIRGVRYYMDDHELVKSAIRSREDKVQG